MNKTALLMGGLGLDAGLIYMLDSERGRTVPRYGTGATREVSAPDRRLLGSHHAKPGPSGVCPLSQGPPGTQVQEAGTERAAVSPCRAARNPEGDADTGLYGARRRYAVWESISAKLPATHASALMA
jgi:hypothetical protein